MDNGLQQDKIYVTRSLMPSYEEYIEEIKPLWDSHWLTNMGAYHQQLETKLAEFLDVQNVSLTANGHMALELTLQALDLPEGGEVITTPYTFISTTHAIIRNGLQPVFCDIKDNYTIDETKIENLITEKTVAIVPVHVYGNICNINAISEIASKHELKVVYDAAHAFGERFHGQPVAGFGDASVFSFHATKVFHTIEGGAVCSNDHTIYDKMYNLKNFGIRSEDTVVAVGANAKMNEFQAIMGLCNLRHIEDAITHRKQLYEQYISILKDTQWLTLNSPDKDIAYNYGYFPVLFKDAKQRDFIYEELQKQDIYTRKYFYPLTCDALCFEEKFNACDLTRARDFSQRVLVLPLYPDLTPEQVERIAKSLIEAGGKCI